MVVLIAERSVFYGCNYWRTYWPFYWYWIYSIPLLVYVR